MEVRGRKGSVEISTPMPVGTVALLNFTIPRKKRVSGQVHLERCVEDSRDYTLIQSKLKESRLDLRREHANAWLWNDVRLVHNDEFLKEFSEKRSEMRAKGRHGREMEERFCFLVASYEATSEIYQFGLRTESQDQCSLGKPSHGVYLFKHVDVALRHANVSACSGKNLIVFKVLFGKVKKVTPCLEWNRTVDPIVGFDCHMAKDAVSYRDSLSQQVLGSWVFLYDYNENQELNKRPRQCLPYAVVSFASAISATAQASISPPVSPTKPSPGLMHGPLEHLKGCTVAKRTGKGENATETFKRFATQGYPDMEHQSQTPGAEASGVDATPFQYNDLQTLHPFIPLQPYMPYYDATECFSPALPYYDNGISWNNYMAKPAFHSNIHNPSTAGISEDNADTLGATPQTEKISTIVYSSRLVKDPRLSRQETNSQKKVSEDEITSGVPECEGQLNWAHSQNLKEKNELKLSYEKRSVELNEGHNESRFPISSLHDPGKSKSTTQPKTENMPSIKLFKMKFQKYAQYFNMTEDERHTKIWSKLNLTLEQKQLLIERIHFYEVHHQRYKQGLLFQTDTETETACSLSHTEPENNDVCPSTLQHSPLTTKRNQCEVTQSHIRHSVSAKVSNLTPTTVLVDNEKNKVDNDELSQNICRPKENRVLEQEQDPTTDSQIEPQDEGVVQAVKEKERISEMFILQGNAQSVPSENFGKTLESTHDVSQSLSPSTHTETHNQGVCYSENPEIPKESFRCKSTLSNTIEDCPEFEQYTEAMEVANCVDISDVPECNGCSYATATEQGQSNTENEDWEALACSKSDEDSEMSIEVERGEGQPNTIYNALYTRLQLDQLLSDSNEAHFFSNKSYLRPKCLDETSVINLPGSHFNEPISKEEELQLIVKIKSSQTPAERLTLSERFSKLRCLGGKLAAFVHVNRLTNCYTAHHKGSLKCKPEALISCNEDEKGRGNNNAELIKLMAQRYNENRFIANCKRLRERRSKVLCRKRSVTSVLNKKTSDHLLFHVRRKTKHIRNNFLLKAYKKHKSKLALKMNSCGQASYSKFASDSSNGLLCTETANDIDKGSDSHLNLAAASQFQSGLQSHGSLVDMGSSQNDIGTNVSTEETSCEDCKSKTKHCDEHFQTKRQCINPVEQATEIDQDDVEKSVENLTLDSKHQTIIKDMDTDRGTSNTKTSLQKKSFLVTFSGRNESSNESSNGESTEPEHKKEALSEKEMSHEDTKVISPDYNTGAYKDTSSPVSTVSSIPGDISSSNVISSCPTKAHTAMTPDSPRVINNASDTQTEARALGDNSVTVLTKGALSTINKSGVTNKTADPQDREVCNNPESTDTSDKGLFSRKGMSDADQSCFNTLKGNKEDVTGIFTKNTNHFSELASGSQCQPSVQDIENSEMNSLVKTLDFHCRFDKVAQENLAMIKDNLHLTWQGQDKYNFPGTSDTQIISKLRDYLTKFEFTVKKQDTVNNSITEAHVPTAWITLDSTAHKQQLHDTRHYSNTSLADNTHRLSETLHFQGAPSKHKQSNRDSQPNSSIPKRRRSDMDRVSPDSTFTETVRNESNSHLVNKDTHQTISGIPNMNHLLQNHENKVQEHQIHYPQENPSRLSGQQGNGPRQHPSQVNQSNEQPTHEKVHTTCIQNTYSVTDISNTLKLADHAVSLTELGPLQSKCKQMLQHFISNFEQDQKVAFYQSCSTRNLVLEKYLDRPPAPVELKFEAINSLLELQMITEACQFVDNKINFLRRKPTFRSLLWYDPSLYGELYKGNTGFQQQSSLFSSFQQCLTSEDYKRLREYYCAVSTLHQQLQDAPDTSYYMYLKTKRERLEIEAAFRNPSDVKSFFLSVPTAIMVNLGDSLEILKKTHDIVMLFIETPADRLPGTFDVGKAEHLSIICRYLQEKILLLKSSKDMMKISWFGMEHLLYDASKVLVWNESERGMPNEVLRKYKKLNSQTVYRVTDHKTDQSLKPMATMHITPPQQISVIRKPPTGVSTERSQTTQNIQVEGGTKETHQPPKRRAAQPGPRSNISEVVTPLIQPSLAAQPGCLPLYTDFTQGSNASHWRTPRNPTWDWSPPDAIRSKSHSEIRALLLSKRFSTPHTKPQTASLTELQNSRPVKQQPLIVKPRPIERSKAQATFSSLQHPELLNEQTNEFSMPRISPFPFQCFSPDTPSVIPPPLPLSFSNPSSQIALHNNPASISYPFFVLNGHAYSTTGSSLPALHTETLPRPV